MKDRVYDRYMFDPVFHTVVDGMIKMLTDYQLTPSEMREAAMLACVQFEQSRTRSTMPSQEETE